MFFFKKMKLNGLLKKLKKLHQAREQGTHADLVPEITCLKEIANFYDKNLYNKKFPRAETLALEYYRAAALLEDAEAQYVCGRRLLEKGHFWTRWKNDICGAPVHQLYADQCYAEAIKFLSEAEASDHIFAKRWHGLAHIRGWGVPVNTDAGFKLVVASIEQQNAWDKATQIFTELGLNSPEFFTALMSLKGQQ